VNGVGGYVGITVPKNDIDHDQVVNVIQMIFDMGSGYFAGSAPNYNISCCTVENLVGYVARYVKLAISPAECKLYIVSFACLSSADSILTRFACR
jgi:hypothetical protein